MHRWYRQRPFYEGNSFALSKISQDTGQDSHFCPKDLVEKSVKPLNLNQFLCDLPHPNSLGSAREWLTFPESSGSSDP